jgi:hypothetical protein
LTTAGGSDCKVGPEGGAIRSPRVEGVGFGGAKLVAGGGTGTSPGGRGAV